MNGSDAIAALHANSGVPVAEIERAAFELRDAGEIASDETWTSHECALLFLRTIAFHLPIDTFIDRVSMAPLVAAHIVEFGTPARGIFGEALEEAPYTSGHCFEVLAETLARHVDAVASGKENRCDYPELEVVSVNISETGISTSLIFQYGHATCKRPTTCILVYGEPSPDSVSGRSFGVHPRGLFGLGEALRARATEPESEPESCARENTVATYETVH